MVLEIFAVVLLLIKTFGLAHVPAALQTSSDEATVIKQVIDDLEPAAQTTPVKPTQK